MISKFFFNQKYVQKSGEWNKLLILLKVTQEWFHLYTYSLIVLQ
jgi:hypothetical protein